MMKYFLTRWDKFLVKYFAAAILSLLLQVATAQPKIDRIEYGIDAIPAYGLATPVTVSSPNVDINNLAFNVNIASLSTGIHTLFIRSRSSVAGDSAKWGITNYQFFFKSANIASSLSNITKLEYFIDTDPGAGKGNPITVTPASQENGIAFTPNISALGIGIHDLFIRSLNANGKWSITNVAYFFKQNNISGTVSNISRIEYFIDSDPGVGKGNPISFTPATSVSGLSFNADISSIATGFHVMFIRSLDAAGKWSITNFSYFYKSLAQNSNVPNIVKIEYFIDTDPGYSNATNIAITPATDISDKSFSADVTGLAIGAHTLGIRSLDSRNNWSVNAIDTFDILGSVPLTLINFSVAAEDTIVDIAWQTAFEQGLGSFEVEHSTDGISFTKIGTVSPENNAAGGSYSFKDFTPSPGENFYRLKIVEADGSFSYSPIKAVRFENGSNYVTIYPNPANDKINVLFKQPLQNNAQIQLRTISGQLIQSFGVAGLSLKQIDASNLANGLYELHVISDKINSSQKIIVQH